MSLNVSLKLDLLLHNITSAGKLFKVTGAVYENERLANTVCIPVTYYHYMTLYALLPFFLLPFSFPFHILGKHADVMYCVVRQPPCKIDSDLGCCQVEVCFAVASPQLVLVLAMVSPTKAFQTHRRYTQHYIQQYNSGVHKSSFTLSDVDISIGLFSRFTVLVKCINDIVSFVH